MKSRAIKYFIISILLLSATLKAEKIESIHLSTDDVELQQLCAEQGNCLQILSESAQSLGKDLLNVVQKVKEQSPRQFTYQDDADISRFKDDLKKQISLCHEESIKLRLATDVNAEVTKKDIKDGEIGIGTWLADGVINLFYWNWKSPEGRQRVILSEIQAETNNVPILKKYLSAEEILRISREVSQEHLVSKNPKENTFYITQETYKKFTAEIIKGVLEENCIESQYNSQFVKQVTADFNKCVDESKVQRNIDICQAKFEHSVGYRVGDKVLDKLIDDNFTAQKPKGWEKKKWLSFLKKKAQNSYLKCADQWFLAEKREDPNDIQVCAYQGVSSAFKETLKLQVTQSLEDSVDDATARSRIVKESLDEYKCSLDDKFRRSDNWNKSDWDGMKTMSADTFKDELNKCVASITTLAGEKVSRDVINNHEAISDTFKDEPQEKEKFVESVMKSGYSVCIGQQNTLIDNYTAGLPKPQDSCSLSPATMSIDPTLCEEMLTMEASIQLVEKGVMDNIESSINGLYPSELQASMKSELVAAVKPILTDCNNRATQATKNNLTDAMNYQIKQSKSTVTKWEKDYLQCSSSAIGLLAYELAVPTLEKELKSTDATKGHDLTFNGADIEKFRKTVSDCYISKISILPTVEKLSSDLDQIGTECAFKGKQMIMPAVLPLILQESLKTYYKDPKKRKSAVAGIMNTRSHEKGLTWEHVFEKAKSDEDVDEYIKRFEASATSTVFGDVLSMNLESFYPSGDAKDGAANQKVHRDLTMKYITPEFEERLYRATKEEAEDLLTETQLDAAFDIASLVLEDNVKDNIKDSKLANKLLVKYKNDLRYCLNKKKNESDKPDVTGIIEKCTENAKIDAYNGIGFRVMRDKINDNIVNTKYANKTIWSLKDRLKQCLEKGRGKKDTALETHLDGCLSDSALIVARNIGDFTMLHYSSSLQSKYSKKQLADYSNSVKEVQRGTRTYPIPLDLKDPAVAAHRTFAGCINTLQGNILKSGGFEKRAVARVFRNDVESAMTKSNVKIGDVTDKIDVCAKKLEGSIANGLKMRFLKTKYPGQYPDHKKDLEQVFELMMFLRADSAASTEEPNDPEDTWEQLKMLGERTVLACNYNKIKCRKFMKRTKKELITFIKNHPKATSEELKDAFYNTSYMRFVVRASVAEVVRDELMDGVADYKDSEGLLENSVDKITSSALMEKALAGKSGRKVVARVIEILKHGDIDRVGEDRVVRKYLTKALTSESPRFVDGLMYGIVEPQLRQERAKPGFMTSLGYMFGVVKKDDLDWNKVKGTKYGKLARDYFSTDILAPLFNGDSIPVSEMDLRSKKLEEMVIKAVKKAS